ncbi:hypothetical protein PR048_017966 [Dryococelus australis]|uniref:Uncharacterized protein n=1 Tax=Dryococelus australis TaxID=614101 RepID=A0ABQ9HB55_9NEOP|nr:hypothetical protein PR048_017966 [Dryococelus australis]
MVARQLRSNKFETLMDSRATSTLPNSDRRLPNARPIIFLVVASQIQYIHALLKFYFRNIPPPRAKEACPRIGNDTKVTTHRISADSSTKVLKMGQRWSSGRPRIFARGNRARRCHWSAGFPGQLPFPPPLHSGSAQYSLRLTLIGSQDLNVTRSYRTILAGSFNETYYPSLHASSYTGCIGIIYPTILAAVQENSPQHDGGALARAREQQAVLYGRRSWPPLFFFGVTRYRLTLEIKQHRHTPHCFFRANTYCQPTGTLFILTIHDKGIAVFKQFSLLIRRSIKHRPRGVFRVSRLVYWLWFRHLRNAQHAHSVQTVLGQNETTAYSVDSSGTLKKLSHLPPTCRDAVRRSEPF